LPSNSHTFESGPVDHGGHFERALYSRLSHWWL
jgi:hypothetical protein